MKKLIRVLLALMVVLFSTVMMPIKVSAADYLYEHNNVSFSGTSAGANEDNRVSMAFTVEVPHIINYVKVQMAKTGSGVGSYPTHHLWLYESDADYKPTGSALASASVSTSGFQQDVFNAFTYNLSVPVQADVGDKFCIVFEAPFVANKVTMYGYDTNKHYLNGHGHLSVNQGAWNDIGTTYDVWFEEWGEPVTYDPPTVSTENTTSITFSSATLNGNLTSLGDYSEVTVGMRIRENGTTIYSNYYPDNPFMNATGTYNVTVSSLAANTTYDVGAFAYYNNATQIAYGDVDQFDTLPYNATPTPPPTAIAPTVTTDGITRIDNATVTLHGTLSSLGSADVVTVGFIFGTGIPAEYYFDAYLPAKTSAGEFTVSLTGLDPAQTYFYQAKAVGDGTSYGEYQSFNNTEIPVVITYANSLGTTSTSTTLHGQLQSMGTYPVVDVYFEYGTTTAYGSIVQPSNHQITSLTYPPGVFFESTLTGLQPLTTYHFRAAAAYGAGQVVYGEDITVTTMPLNELDFPAVYTYPATNVTVSGATFNGALTRLGNLTWLESLGYPANVTVGFEVQKAGSTTWNSANYYGTQSMNATGNYSITPSVWLEPNTHYNYRAVVAMWPSISYDNPSLIFRGNIQSFYTNPEVTQTPYQVSLNAASNLTKNSAKVSALVSGLASNTTDVAVQFKYGLGDFNNPTGIQNSPYIQRTGNGLIEFTITGLSPGTTYWYSAYAMSSGSSVVGTPNYLSFTTLNADGSTPGITPTPTPTPTGRIGPIPVPSDPGDRWLLVLAGLVLIPLVFMFMFMKVPMVGGGLSVAGDVVWFGYAMFKGWVDLWIILLLAMGVGALAIVIVWRVLHGRTA